MGAAGSSLPEGELQEILNDSKYNKNEIKSWYKTFIKDYPLGYLDEEKFHDLYNKTYQIAEANREKTDLIFKSFDVNNDGQISFKELVSSLSVLKRGSLREKVKWVFDIYDIDGDGRITMEELNDIVKSIHDTQATDCKGRKISATRMNSVFNFVDQDMDGYVTLDEFVEGIENNPELASILNCGQEKPLLTCDGT